MSLKLTTEVAAADQVIAADRSRSPVAPPHPTKCHVMMHSTRCTALLRPPPRGNIRICIQQSSPAGVRPPSKPERAGTGVSERRTALGTTFHAKKDSCRGERHKHFGACGRELPWQLFWVFDEPRPKRSGAMLILGELAPHVSVMSQTTKRLPLPPPFRHLRMTRRWIADMEGAPPSRRAAQARTIARGPS
jgi:hypothetical protein